MQHTLVWVAVDNFILDWKCAEIFSAIFSALKETFDEITTNSCGKKWHASSLSEIGIIRDLNSIVTFY